MDGEAQECWHHLDPNEVRPGDLLADIDGHHVRGGVMEVREIRHKPAHSQAVYDPGTKAKTAVHERPETWEFMPVRRTRSSRFAYAGQTVKVARKL